MSPLENSNILIFFKTNFQLHISRSRKVELNRVFVAFSTLANLLVRLTQTKHYAEIKKIEKLILEIEIN